MKVLFFVMVAAKAETDYLSLSEIIRSAWLLFLAVISNKDCFPIGYSIDTSNSSLDEVYLAEISLGDLV